MKTGALVKNEPQQIAAVVSPVRPDEFAEKSAKIWPNPLFYQN
jgi:hypothetical protein